MSVEDSRLLACPFFWSVFGDRTGLRQIARNEKAVCKLPLTNGFHFCYETQMKNFITRGNSRTTKSKTENADWQELFCNYRKYYVCRSWIVSQMMTLNRDKTPAFCRKHPQISDVFPNNSHVLFLGIYRKMKINEKRCRIIFTRNRFRL